MKGKKRKKPTTLYNSKWYKINYDFFLLQLTVSKVWALFTIHIHRMRETVGEKI
jgi:hypothetical protein